MVQQQPMEQKKSQQELKILPILEYWLKSIICKMALCWKRSKKKSEVENLRLGERPKRDPDRPIWKPGRMSKLFEQIFLL